jgi:hypothetical protein
VLLLAALHARGAGAQTVTQSGALYPDRIVNGQDLGVSTRPQNLNPLGISYDDCTSDMTLQFTVSVSGFSGQNLAVWASKTSDCTSPLDRGIGTGGNVCWFLNQPLSSFPSATATTITVKLRVRDIVGSQDAIAPVQTLQPSNQGPSACFAQQGFAAVPINVNFLPLDSSGNVVGTAYKYVLNTDLVGPPAPSGVSETVGNTLFNVTWTANTDTDTTGYDIFIDPPPGQDASAPTVQLMEVCPDSGGSTPVSDASDDADLDASSDAAMSTPDATSSSDAGCYFINVSGTGESVDGGSCSDPTLQSAIVQDAGAVTTIIDDASDEGGVVTTESGSGGISTIPTQFLITPGNGTGITVSDKSATQFKITGLTNIQMYNVVVAAVDGYGNVGPSSNDVCDFPAPTQDFWTTYKNDGGGAGGGFCALEAPGAPVPSLVGAGFLVAAVALVRRRKRGSR